MATQHCASSVNAPNPVAPEVEKTTDPKHVERDHEDVKSDNTPAAELPSYVQRERLLAGENLKADSIPTDPPHHWQMKSATFVYPRRPTY
jgi:hypothetical protein